MNHGVAENRSGFRYLSPWFASWSQSWSHGRGRELGRGVASDTPPTRSCLPLRDYYSMVCIGVWGPWSSSPRGLRHE